MNWSWSRCLKEGKFDWMNRSITMVKYCTHTRQPANQSAASERACQSERRIQGGKLQSRMVPIQEVLKAAVWSRAGPVLVRSRSGPVLAWFFSGPVSVTTQEMVPVLSLS